MEAKNNLKTASHFCIIDRPYAKEIRQTSILSVFILSARLASDGGSGLPALLYLSARKRIRWDVSKAQAFAGLRLPSPARSR